jgi:dephospho-CoA kinase
MLRVALTGGIASGKSYVRARLDALGLPTVDADVLAREAVLPGSPGLAAVVQRFGSQMLDAHGRLDRVRLGEAVFSDPGARRDLEAIIHPRVYAAIEVWFDALAASTGPGLGIADIPLLFETGHEGGFDLVIVAFCSPELQVARVQARDRVSSEAARQRLAAQWPIAEKVRLADYVVRTDGTFAETDEQVERVARALRDRASRESR